jgi:CheY-like chemotaxis protein
MFTTITCCWVPSLSRLAVRLRDQALAQPPRCIALTGLCDISAQQRTNNAGMQEHLAKPVDPEGIVAAVTGGDPSSVLECGGGNGQESAAGEHFPGAFVLTPRLAVAFVQALDSPCRACCDTGKVGKTRGMCS